MSLPGFPVSKIISRCRSQIEIGGKAESHNPFNSLISVFISADNDRGASQLL
jgi:hypothetical protein